MKIIHVSTSDLAGGAARAAHRLHDGLRRLGEDSEMLVLRSDGHDPHIHEFHPPQNPLAQLRRRLRRFRIERDFSPCVRTRPAGLEAFTDDRTKYGRSVWKRFPDCDVINLHWTRGFLDLGDFFHHAPAPVVWTLHDMNAFTGGCHYALGCVKFRVACGACPQLGSHDVNDLSRQIWLRKEGSYRKSDLHLITPSRWMEQKVRESSLLKSKPVSTIPYGLDTAVFAPFEKNTARNKFQIPPHASVVLFVADFLDNQRKGFSFLVEALNRLRLQDVVLVSMGKDPPNCELRARHIHLGRLNDDGLLAMAYSAADLFVIPSMEDNLPNTVLEAMACGTPVVGFDAGGIHDMVRDNLTGRLAPVGDVDALANVMGELLQDGERRREMSKRSRDVASREYPLELQARRYQELYQRVCRTPQPHGGIQRDPT